MLLTILLGGLLVALLSEGYSAHRVGRSTTAAAAAAREPLPGLADAGPVLDAARRDIRSASPPARTVALTFDDGPDPEFTPAVLRILRRHNVPATFFVVGSRVLRHPELVRRMRREGHEVGSHTFTHSDVARLPGWRMNLELSLTQTALAGAAGIRTSLFRAPFSSEPTDVDRRDLAAYRDIGGLGYLVVMATHDGRDWEAKSVDAILDRATPRGGQGAVVLLHDGGGDRSRTLLALEQIIVRLQSEGYRFTTVSGAVGLPAGRADAKVSGAGRLQGLAFLRAQQIGGAITRALMLLLLPIAVLTAARAALLVFIARRHSRRQAAPRPLVRPSVSVVVPAFNEVVGIGPAVESLVRTDYPDVEVLVVDDGSTDGTAEVVERLALPNVRVLRQPNQGKAVALNHGIAASTSDVVVTVDGDTVFEPDTIDHLVAPFAAGDVGAVSGNTKVGNRRGLLGKWQHIEYVMGFNLDRRMFEVLDCIPTVPGAIGAFRRDALAQVGGMSDDTLAEDTDLTMALNRAGWRVVYEPNARAWTEAPATLGALWRQRYRWSYGTLQAMWKHRAAIREPEHHQLGRRALPYLLVFQVLLPALAPAIDLFALYGVLFLRPGPVIAYWLSFNVLQLAIGAYAFRLDGERLRPLWLLPLQQVVYRQLMYLVVIQSLVTAVRGTRLRWHKLPRTGDVAVGPG